MFNRRSPFKASGHFAWLLSLSLAFSFFIHRSDFITFRPIWYNERKKVWR
ncbi:hypothetical protein HMPREF0083_00760 [Aneurinibacillus aneurinilyticus ATCC 12856]|uniref:Uncharacterized protein n=1 Tax=Aneurinibacillus aneurinilyticus ATCC 12856 TaxID=649747 RepID=U1WR82_ANEAE|nr:hypothetical protein HMPREF0083_00760 [Aneurinibacillus aneurinilyticus ATCC 12856]